MEPDGRWTILVVPTFVRQRNTLARIPDYLSTEEVFEEERQGRGAWVRPRVLAPGSSEDLRQKKVLEDLSQEGNRDEAEALNVVEIEDTNASEVDVPLTRKRKVETSGVGSSSQSKGKAVEVVDNYTICGVPPLQRTISVNPSGEVVLESPSPAA
ncbi:hypothetical protein Adt_28196 [Abeliophyllum distichum]|uniref:Uncharacterized protein n=1 Tax=Abeliophyllum distichum TaxID=126358 RepID=A0ABD1RW90_9LAMI